MSRDDPMSRVYDDLETMFRDRGVKQRDDGSFAEDSYDYGVWWHDEGGGSYRLTWIGGQMRDEPEKAGELYLVCLSPPRLFAVIGSDVARESGVLGAQALMIAAGKATGMVELLCVIPPFVDDGRPCEYVDRILDGWADVCGGENSVAWVRGRAAAAIADGVAEPGKEPHHA